MKASAGEGFRSHLLVTSFRMRVRAPHIFAHGIYISEMMLYACYCRSMGFGSTSCSVAFPDIGEVNFAVRESDAQMNCRTGPCSDSILMDSVQDAFAKAYISDFTGGSSRENVWKKCQVM